MPLPGEINSPVCWANGSGQDYTHQGTDVPSPQRLSCVAPWMYPWQTPVGVMQEAATTAGEIQIQMAGEFRVPLTDVYPRSSADIAQLTSLYNRRVYYDWYTGAYIVREVPIEAPDESTPAAIYPGSATIGYISDVDLAAEEVGITIDPRPATATYEICLASTVDDDWLQGTPITLDPATRIITPCDESSTKCDGLAVWWLKPLGAEPSEYEQMVVVTSGLTWYLIDGETFYGSHTTTDFATRTPSCVPIDITGKACSLENESEAIIIGNITLNKWYPIGEHTLPTFGLLDVKRFVPETSTVTMLQPLS